MRSGLKSDNLLNRIITSILIMLTGAYLTLITPSRMFSMMPQKVILFVAFSAILWLLYRLRKKHLGETRQQVQLALVVIAAMIVTSFQITFYSPAQEQQIILRANRAEDAPVGEIWLVSLELDGDNLEISAMDNIAAEGWIYNEEYDDYVYYPNEDNINNSLTIRTTVSRVGLFFAENPWSGSVEIEQQSGKKLLYLKAETAQDEALCYVVENKSDYSLTERVVQNVGLAIISWFVFSTVVLLYNKKANEKTSAQIFLTDDWFYSQIWPFVKRRCLYTMLAATVLLAVLGNTVLLPAAELRIVLHANCEDEKLQGEVWLTDYAINGLKQEVSTLASVSSDGWSYHTGYDDYVYYPTYGHPNNKLVFSVKARSINLVFAANPWSGAVQINAGNKHDDLVLKTEDGSENRSYFINCFSASHSLTEYILYFTSVWTVMTGFLLVVYALFRRVFYKGHNKNLLPADDAELRTVTSEKHGKAAIAIRVLAFVLVLALLMLPVSMVIGKIDSNWSYYTVLEFFSEKPNSLDAVYIGPSTVFMSWEAPLAWKHYGITVRPFASDGQNACISEYLIREARKTQPDALYIIQLGFKYGHNDSVLSNIHSLTDFLPRNLNRLRLINRWMEYQDFSYMERVEFYFPLLRFHSRWSDLRDRDYRFMPGEMKAGSLNANVTDVSDGCFISDDRVALNQNDYESISSLLDYLKNNPTNVLFVISQASRSKESQGMINSAYDLVREQGYPVLDMRDLPVDGYLNPSTDFYDSGHVNIHGAVKTTDYLARYLTANYDFEDKRDNPDYSDWNDACTKYVEKIAPYTLPFEYEKTEWNNQLDAPKVEASNTDGRISWEAIDDTDGYGIFRKQGGAWELCAMVDVDTLEWTDSSYVLGSKYTVAGFTKAENGLLWGNYDIVTASK